MRSTKSLQFVLWCIILSLQTTSCQGLSHLNPLGGGDTLVIEHKHKHLLMEFDQVPRYYSETYELDWPVSLGDKDVSDLQNYLMANIIALEAQDENIDDYINYIPEGGQVVAQFPPHAWDDISNYYEHITKLICEQVPGRFAVLTIKMHESSLGMPHTTDCEEEIAERQYVCYDLTNNSFVMLNDLFLPEHLDDLSDLCAEHLFDASPAILANCEMEEDGSHLNVNYGQLVLSPGHIGLEFGNALEGYQLVDLAVENVAEWLTSYGQKLMDVKAPKDDDNQYITLSDCPTTDNAITFTTTKTPDEYPCYETITVTKRGHEPQTFDIEGFQCSDDQPLVHFVDANFDGHTDTMPRSLYRCFPRWPTICPSRYFANKANAYSAPVQAVHGHGTSASISLKATRWSRASGWPRRHPISMRVILDGMKVKSICISCAKVARMGKSLPAATSALNCPNTGKS